MKYRDVLITTIIILICSNSNAGGLQAVHSTTNSVTLSWTAPGDDNCSGQATEYDIRYSRYPITTANWGYATQVIAPPSPGMACSPESFEVTGLNRSTLYYFAVKTGDEVPNWSMMSSVVCRATVAESTPPSDINDLGVADSGPSSVTLSWTATGDDGFYGTATQYDIRYSTSVITASNWRYATQVVGESLPRAAGSAETFTISGVGFKRTNYFAIRAVDEAWNWSPLSNVVFVECCQGRVGNANGEGVYPNEVTVGDLMVMIDALFISEDCSRLACVAEADLNQDGGANPTCRENVTVGDLGMMINFLFYNDQHTFQLKDCK